MEEEVKPIFALPAVVIHQPNILKTEIGHQKQADGTFSSQVYPHSLTQESFNGKTVHLETKKLNMDPKKIERQANTVLKSNSDSIIDRKLNFSKRIVKRGAEDPTTNSRGNPRSLNFSNSSEKLKNVEEKVGLVLAVRSLVQLLVTPLVAKVSSQMGYTRPLIIGCCILLASTTSR